MMITSPKIYTLLLTAVLIWCITILLPPMISITFGKSNIFTEAGYRFFNHICHQYEERSIHIAGEKLGVCSRCSSIYFGFLFGIILLPILKKLHIKNITLGFLLITAPMIIDIGLDYFGIHTSNLFTRIVSGLIFGTFAVILIYPSYEEAFKEKFHKLIEGSTYVRKT